MMMTTTEFMILPPCGDETTYEILTNSPHPILFCDAPSPPLAFDDVIIFKLFCMSNLKLIEATQLALANFDIHLVQDFPHLLLRDPKIFSDSIAIGAGKIAVFGFLFDCFLQFPPVHYNLQFNKNGHARTMQVLF